MLKNFHQHFRHGWNVRKKRLVFSKRLRIKQPVLFFANFAGVKRIPKYIYTVTALLLASVLKGFAQDPDELAIMNGHVSTGLGSDFMEYQVMENGDTVYFAMLRPSVIWQRQPRQKGRYWRQYYRLVHNFSKVYPYSVAARELIAETDSTIAAEDFSRRQREQYIADIQKRLLAAYEQPLRHMTVTQGKLLIKLIDREIGKSSYDIIRDYTNRAAAGFWQGIAKMFGSDLKKKYDPEGDDKQVEELIKIWEEGEFAGLYWSIFGEYPIVPIAPEL